MIRSSNHIIMVEKTRMTDLKALRLTETVTGAG